MRHLAIVTVAVAGIGSAQAQLFDDVGRGQAGQWGCHAHCCRFMTRGGQDGAADFTLGSDGTINVYVT